MDVIENAADLRDAILDRYDTLSPRLRDIERFVLDNPHDVGVETLAVTAKRVGVPASAIVRFAKQFGFDGAAPMQRLLKDGLLARQTDGSYHQRIRQFNDLEDDEGTPAPSRLLGEFASASKGSLDGILDTVSEEVFDHAVELIATAQTIHVAGFRRSFPVAAYLAYSLQQGGKRTILIDGVGGLAKQQLGRPGRGDLLIGISFNPYAQEVVDLVDLAAGTAATICAITDSVVSPIAKAATCVLPIRDTQVRGFRTLAASMCVAQSLAIAQAIRRDDHPQRAKKAR